MNRKTIDNIVWWIPFKKLRNYLRDILNILVDITESDKLTQENNYHINTKLDNINCKIDMFEKSIEDIKNELNKIILQNTIIEARQKLSLLNNKIIKETRQPRLIVSLTTYPERHHDVDVVIYSLLTQSILPDKIVLWLSNEEYPNGLDSVPENILRLQQLGLEIDFCENITCYKNYIPSLIKYPNDIIVTADDDIYYPKNWLDLLYNAYLENPNYLNAHRGQRIVFDKIGNIKHYLEWIPSREAAYPNTVPSFLNFPSGTGAGVIITKDILYKDITDKELFLKLSPTNDDVWLWAMAVLKGVKINFIKNGIYNFRDMSVFRNYNRLCTVNWDNNLIYINNILDYYPDIKNKVKFNTNEYWEIRYKTGGNSGEGSYGKLAAFKTEIINNFITNNNIKSIIEWGCGDGNQLETFKVPIYYGLEISPYIVNILKLKFEKDKTKTFSTVSEYNGFKYDCAMSLDVIFTIINDDVYKYYMNELFSSANKYVIIHSSNKEEHVAAHVKHRKFTDWIDKNTKCWKLYRFIENNLNTLEGTTSFNDFYIYVKEDKNYG